MRREWSCEHDPVGISSSNLVDIPRQFVHQWSPSELFKSFNLRLPARPAVTKVYCRCSQGKWPQKLTSYGKVNTFGPAVGRDPSVVMVKTKWQPKYDDSVWSHISRHWGREADVMHLLCVHPGKEDVCTELFTYAIRKIILRLEMVVFFALSVGVVLMKSTEDEGISTKATVKI